MFGELFPHGTVGADWVIRVNHHVDEEVLLFVYWAEARGSMLVTSADMYVKGWSFRLASISTTMASRTGSYIR